MRLTEIIVNMRHIIVAMTQEIVGVRGKLFDYTGKRLIYAPRTGNSKYSTGITEYNV